MENKILGQEPAFPTIGWEAIRGGDEIVMTTDDPGMPKRLLIAKDILCALITANPGYNNHIYVEHKKELCKSAIELTNELLKQEYE